MFCKRMRSLLYEVSEAKVQRPRRAGESLDWLISQKEFVL